MVLNHHPPLLTRFDPSKRISAKAALDHHYFRSRLVKILASNISFYLKKSLRICFSVTLTRPHCQPSQASSIFPSRTISRLRPSFKKLHIWALDVKTLRYLSHLYQFQGHIL